MVRRNELACRDEWSHDLWALATGEGPGQNGTMNGPSPARPEPAATSREIAAVIQPNQLSGEFGASRPPEDVVLGEARLIGDATHGRDQGHDDSEPSREPNNREAIIKARDAYRERFRVAGARPTAIAGPHSVSPPRPLHPRVDAAVAASGRADGSSEAVGEAEAAPIDGVAALAAPSNREVVSGEVERDFEFGAGEWIDSEATISTAVGTSERDEDASMVADRVDSAPAAGTERSFFSGRVVVEEPGRAVAPESMSRRRSEAVARFARALPGPYPSPLAEGGQVAGPSEVETSSATDADVSGERMEAIERDADHFEADAESDPISLPDAADGIEQWAEEEGDDQGDSRWQAGARRDDAPSDVVIALAPSLPRVCRTCRDYRPAEGGERGWCANEWAFTHPRMVDPSDAMPCQTSVGSWWLPFDEVWLRAADVSGHGQPTPLIDAVIPLRAVGTRGS